MKRIVSAALVAVLISSLALGGCSAEKTDAERFTKTSLDVFDTSTVVTGFAESEEAFDEMYGYIVSSLTEYHQLYDIYKSYDGVNNIKTINDNAGVAPVKVDGKLIDLLEMSIEMYNVTGGRTNIAMGSVLSIWHTYREAGINEPETAKLPPLDELQSAAGHTDINKIVIDRENSTVYLDDSEMSLDVGATAKGYATERVAESCEEKGWCVAMSVGGNVRTIGTKPDGERWSIGIQNPDLSAEQSYFCKVALDGKSLVTSGSYQRYYTVDGVNYHHIIDPETLMPENYYLSVSVICEDSGVGDALSTALFNMKADEGMALVEGLENTEAVWVYPDGTRDSTSGFEALLDE